MRKPTYCEHTKPTQKKLDVVANEIFCDVLRCVLYTGPHTTPFAW